MKIQGADLRDKNRIPLKDVFPMDTPMSMYIEPSNLCNIQCKFCPTGDRNLIKSVGRTQGIMEWITYWMILADLSKFNKKIKLINFFKDGEPLVNKNFPEMARGLRPYCDKLMVRTNGLLLNPDLNKRIVTSGFDRIGISVIAPHADGYKKIAGKSIDYQEFINNVKDLYDRRNFELYIKMANVDFSEDEISKFYADFEPISDFIFVENLHGWSRTDLKDFTLGHTDNTTFDGVPNINKVVCAWPLYQMTINWNGMVQPCNEDWSWVNVMGNIEDNSLQDIWNGEKFIEFRRMQLQGLRSTNKACGTCWQTMSQIENVDDCREELLERIKA